MSTDDATPSCVVIAVPGGWWTDHGARPATRIDEDPQMFDRKSHATEQAKTLTTDAARLGIELTTVVTDMLNGDPPVPPRARPLLSVPSSDPQSTGAGPFAAAKTETVEEFAIAVPGDRPYCSEDAETDGADRCVYASPAAATAELAQLAAEAVSLGASDWWQGAVVRRTRTTTFSAWHPVDSPAVSKQAGQQYRSSTSASSAHVPPQASAATTDVTNTCEDPYQGMGTVTEYAVEHVLEHVAVGDPHSWDSEIRWLWETLPDQMAELMQLVLREGIQTPLAIGHNPASGYERMWDGHHRIAIAVALRMPTIPVRIIDSNDP